MGNWFGIFKKLDVKWYIKDCTYIFNPNKKHKKRGEKKTETLILKILDMQQKVQRSLESENKWGISAFISVSKAQCWWEDPGTSYKIPSN